MTEKKAIFTSFASHITKEKDAGSSQIYSLQCFTV